METLEELRVSIDKIDEEIMSLLDKRFNLTIKVGQVKSVSKISVLDTRREEIILNKISKYGHSQKIDAIYKMIMESSKSLQRE